MCPCSHLPAQNTLRIIQEVEERALMAKEWARYTMREHRQDMRQKVVRYKLRQAALEELRRYVT